MVDSNWVLAITAVISVVGILYWNHRNHRQAVKKDILIQVGGAINTQVLTVVMAAQPDTAAINASQILIENNRIYGQMYCVADAQTSRVVMEFVGIVAAEFSDVSLLALKNEAEPLELIRIASLKLEKLLTLIPSVITEIKKELKIQVNVFELECQIEKNNSIMREKLEKILDIGKS